MKELLKQLQDYAEASPNVYLQIKLLELENEIHKHVHEERMKVYYELIKMI
jgi:hypothetical protein